MLQKKISAFCCSIFQKQKSCFIAIDFPSQGLCGYHHEGRQGGSKCPLMDVRLLSLAPEDFLEKNRLCIQILWIQGLRVLKIHHVFCCSMDSFPTFFLAPKVMDCKAMRTSNGFHAMPRTSWAINQLHDDMFTHQMGKVEKKIEIHFSYCPLLVEFLCNYRLLWGQ